jgi:hypothetical protein
MRRNWTTISESSFWSGDMKAGLGRAIHTVGLLLVPLFIPPDSLAQETHDTIAGPGVRSLLIVGVGSFPDQRLGSGQPSTLGTFRVSQAAFRPLLQEGNLLPVYDDAGERIYRFEVEAEMDRGLRGLAIGTLLGSAIGAGFFHIIFSQQLKCGEDSRGDLCSPQEKAMRDKVPLWGSILGAVGIGYVGFRIDQKTWDEALELVRRNRRLGQGVPSAPTQIREKR